MIRKITSFRANARKLLTAHPEFRVISERFGHPQLPITRPVNLEALVLIILEQQVAVKAARTLFKRLKNKFGQLSARKLVTIGQQGLRNNGLTRQKAEYCYLLALAISERRFSITKLSAMSDEDAASALVALKGIGPWTASIFMMNSLQRTDVWPPGDLALDRAIDELLPEAQRENAKQGLLWRPYRSVAAEYLWHHYRNTRNQERPGSC